MTEFVTRSPEETFTLGEKLGRALPPGSVIALEGALGSGQTVLTKGIARALGITEPVTSPTYTLIAEYDAPVPLCHLDLYRIDGEEEFENLGAEELFRGNGLSVIEWSERAGDALPSRTVNIRIYIESEGARRITAEGWQP